MNLELKNLFLSIFDNAEELIKRTFAEDGPLSEWAEFNRAQNEKIAGYKTHADEHDAKATAAASTITELRERIRDLDTQRRKDLGDRNAYRFKIKNAERRMRDIATRVGTRQTLLLRKMVDKRLNAIGKKIVTNNGWRAKKDPATAGGISVIPDDGLLPGGRRNPDSVVTPGMDNIMTRHLEDGGSPAG